MENPTMNHECRSFTGIPWISHSFCFFPWRPGLSWPGATDAVCTETCSYLASGQWPCGEGGPCVCGGSTTRTTTSTATTAATTTATTAATCHGEEWLEVVEKWMRMKIEDGGKVWKGMERQCLGSRLVLESSVGPCVGGEMTPHKPS